MTDNNELEEIINHVAWAVHRWSCPIASDLCVDHVTNENRMMAAFLVGALGLVKDDNDS